jgi:hypothetical protein
MTRSTKTISFISPYSLTGEDFNFKDMYHVSFIRLIISGFTARASRYTDYAIPVLYLKKNQRALKRAYTCLNVGRGRGLHTKYTQMFNRPVKYIFNKM